MAPVWGNLAKGNQYESPILQARVRQDQAIGGFGPLALRRQAQPGIERGAIRQDSIAKTEKVEVESPRAPALFSFTSVIALDGVERFQKLRRR